MCCQSQEEYKHNLNTSSIEDWWSSDFLAGIRQKMLADESPKECVRCYKQEKLGIISDRQKANKDYKVVEQYAVQSLNYYGYPADQPLEIEFQLTNLCNLKCLMCSEGSSSSILAENKLLKINTSGSRDYSITVKEIQEMKTWMQSKPKMIRLCGGEPMMVAEIKQAIQWGLSNGLLDNTELHITTNATKLDDEWLDILSKIKNLRIMISVDAVGQLNDYIRYGSDWDTIVTNIEKMSQIPNVNLVIHATIQNLNILYIDKLILWCKEHNYYFDYGLIEQPAIYSLSNLPMELIEQAKENLKDNKTFLTLLENVEPTNSWEELKKEINMRDAFRKTSIINVIPEFKEYWNA